MEAVAARNARVGNPVYHVMVSWPAGENPSDDQAFACGEHMLQTVGMVGHQRVFAIHRDTGNVHLHVAVNRVHPVSLRAVYPDRDYFKLDRAMRELELGYGWSHDAGPHVVRMRDGRAVIEWRDAGAATKGRTPTGAADMERHADRESLFSYVRGAPRKAVARLLAAEELRWQDVHQVLAQYGLALREKGQGLAVYDLHGEASAPVKASDVHELLSKGSLTGRLGPFQGADTVDVSLVRTAERYDQYRSPSRREADVADAGDRGTAVSTGRQSRRQARADLRRKLQERYRKYRSQFTRERLQPTLVKVRYAALSADAKRRRQLVSGAGASRAERKAQYSLIAFETLLARARLREEIAEERALLEQAYREWVLDFRHWVEHQAAMGDPGAISQLRGWAHTALRAGGGRPAHGRQRNLIWKTVDLDPSAHALMDGVPFRVRRDGAVRHSAGLGIIDHGDKIELEGDAPPPDSVIAVALLLAARKFGPDYALSGSDTFQTAARRLAARFPREQDLLRELRRRSATISAPRPS